MTNWDDRLSLINGTNNPEPVPFHKDFAPDESSPSPSERNYQLRMYNTHYLDRTPHFQMPSSRMWHLFFS